MIRVAVLVEAGCDLCKKARASDTINVRDPQGLVQRLEDVGRLMATGTFRGWLRYRLEDGRIGGVCPDCVATRDPERQAQVRAAMAKALQ